MKLVVSFLSGFLAVSLAAMAPGDVPNPIIHYLGCGRDHPSQVCDPSNYIKADEFAEIDEKLDQLRNRFEGPEPCEGSNKGYEVGVAIIDQMSHPWSAEVFAHNVYNNWGLGDSNCNNGLLIFLSILDRQVYIVTGDSTRLRISDSRTQDIIFAMRPFLRKEHYGSAILAGLLRAETFLLGDEERLGWDAILSLLLVPAFFAFVAHSIFEEHFRKKELQIVRNKLRELENDRDKLQKNAYEIESCPICLELLTFPEDDNTGQTERSNTPDALPQLSRWNVLKRIFSDGLESVLLFLRLKKKSDYTAVTQMESKSRDAFALECGHIFCESCIKDWLVKKATCPICKKSLTMETRDTSSNFPVNNAAINRVNNRGMLVRHMRSFEEHLWWDSLRYRMGRLNDRYPRYVNDRMLREFHQEPRQTFLTRHQHFVREQARFERSGGRTAGTTHTNFGGGRSAGGGGGGW